MGVIRAAAAALLFASTPLFADYREFRNVPVDPSVVAGLRRAAEATLRDFPGLKPENLAISVVDLTGPAALRRGDYNGEAPFYPASVIKLFFMAEVFHQHKENIPDMPRALREMIAVSDNDATAFVIDVISGTCSGPELQGRALRRFIEKRRVVNRWLQPLGYDISAMMKPWSFGPFGRDMQALGENRVNRNRARANDVASLLLWIVRRRAVSPQASDAMMALMERPLSPPRNDENQVREFIGEALPEGAKLWSKAGWTSEVRHDAACIELPDGRKWIVVIHTRGVSDDVTILPAIMKKVLAELPPAALPR
ncbi:MAG TPA: serine hydrolase [Thermoanaerobaculia bacterium]|nr:serine hydrolase [Thermoanaerobaculia bacterium]